MPRQKTSRNFLGTILERQIIRHGKKTTVFDVRKRIPRVDSEGNPILDARGRRTYQDKTQRTFSRSEAQAALLNMPARIEREAAKTISPTFNDLADYFDQEYVKAPVYVGGQKIAGYKIDLDTVRRQIKEYRSVFGQMLLSSISYEHIRSFAEKVATTPLKYGSLPSAATVNKTLSMLRHILNVGIQLGWMSENPFRRGPALIRKSSETKRGRMLTFVEEAALLAACTDRRAHLRTYILLSLDTAMRRGEIYSLQWWQVDFENRVIYIKDEAAAKTKTGVAGILPMTTRLRDDLSAIQDRRTPLPSDLVVGKMDFKRAWSSACELAGIEGLQFRDLRSTAATRMMLAGNAGDLVRKVTRHTQVETFFDHYTNVDLENTRLIGDKLQEFLDGQQPISALKPDDKVENKGDSIH